MAKPDGLCAGRISSRPSELAGQQALSGGSEIKNQLWRDETHGYTTWLRHV
jgi:hypothetical protein